MKNGEKIVGPMPYNHAVIYISKLIEDSQAFIGGSKPLIGRLKTSYGYKKVIGIVSFDHQVRLRIDWDVKKGFHFNYENFHTGEKICVRIGDMTTKQYQRYIDNQTKGRCPILTPKRPNFIRSEYPGEASIEVPKDITGDKLSRKYVVVNKINQELFEDKFVLDYYNELLNMANKNEIELSDNEILDINNNKSNLINKINKNLFFLDDYCIMNDINLDMDDLSNYYTTDENNNTNNFKK